MERRPVKRKRRRLKQRLKAVGGRSKMTSFGAKRGWPAEKEDENSSEPVAEELEDALEIVVSLAPFEEEQAPKPLLPVGRSPSSYSTTHIAGVLRTARSRSPVFLRITAQRLPASGTSAAVGVHFSFSGSHSSGLLRFSFVSLHLAIYLQPSLQVAIQLLEDFTEERFEKAGSLLSDSEKLE
nr:hypothetical protein Iba_chr01aCG5620 [Ipomoea batatas]